MSKLDILIKRLLLTLCFFVFLTGIVEISKGKNAYSLADAIATQVRLLTKD